MASGGSKVWSIFSLLAGVLGATIARKSIATTWKAATGKQPPANPADPEVELWEAVAWAAASGVAVGVTRMIMTRRAAEYYARSTGHLPPNLGPATAETDDSTQATSSRT